MSTSKNLPPLLQGALDVTLLKIRGWKHFAPEDVGLPKATEVENKRTSTVCVDCYNLGYSFLQCVDPTNEAHVRIKREEYDKNPFVKKEVSYFVTPGDLLAIAKVSSTASEEQRVRWSDLYREYYFKPQDPNDPRNEKLRAYYEVHGCVPWEELTNPFKR